MKFNAKLQSLRKDNKLSQEQLADMLNVSRQSVSKWESGQTYPEMDKLLMMCKIFNCSLDDLVNENIKEINAKENSKTINKNVINTFVDEILDITNRSVNMFKQMSSKQITKTVIELIIILFVLSIFKYPFDYIYSLGQNIFNNFGFKFGNILSSLWHFLIETSYLILFIITFIYIYKNAYLDKFNDLKSEFDLKDNKIQKEETVHEKVTYKEKESKRNYSFLDFLVKIFILIVKTFTVFFSISFIFALLFLSASLVISIMLIFKGVFYFGIIIGIIALILLDIFFITIIFNFIFNRKNNVKNALVMFITSIALLGVAGGFITYEVARTEYIDSAPSTEKMTILKEQYDFSKDLLIIDYNNFEFIKDDKMKNKVDIEINYYSGFTKVTLNNSEKNKILIGKDIQEIEAPRNVLFLLIKDLSKKQLHNYHQLFKITVKITTSSSNIDIIKNNQESYYQTINETNIQNQFNRYENELHIKDQEIDNLQEENDNLRIEVDEYKNKIQEYKNKVNELLGL